ncbi:MAG: hypothetical protein CL607_00430 [Anaerolineaceae bacterium]|nr:hypothetical protein [Anaerolineaceae bacterium]
MTGVWLAIAVLYRYDYGITAMDVDGVNHLTCLGGLGDVAAWIGNNGYDAHLGDSESIRLFLRSEDGGWALDHLEMKRHFDPWEEVELNEFERIIQDETGYHVLVMASESKHGMYTSKDQCEDYSHDIHVPVLGLPTGCSFNIEDCADDPDHEYWILNAPFEHNVGEMYAPYNPFSRQSLAQDFFGSNNHAWSHLPFCAGTDVFVGHFDPPDLYIGNKAVFTFHFEDCAGSLIGKWLHPSHVFIGESPDTDLFNLQWTRPMLRTLAQQDEHFAPLVEWAPFFARPSTPVRIG